MATKYDIPAIICTFDNLPILQDQLSILRRDPLVTRIVVMNQESLDGTKEFLDNQSDVTVIHRKNDGAGPGRNAGLDAAGEFDFCLMLDGGIRPLINGTQHMLDYLEAHPKVDVISPEVASCFTTDPEMAHRRMVEPIDEKKCFHQNMLSSTAYALCRYRAWDGIRFSEEGPYGEPGWGVDDNEMAFRWAAEGIVHHDFSGVLCYRRASGSFARLYKETGIYPNQFGSVYEARLVKLWQDYPRQWNKWGYGQYKISAVVVGWNEYPMFVRAIKRIHDELADIPHEVIFVDNGSDDETKWWLDTFALRQFHGDTTIDAATGEIMRRGPDNEEIWTGDVIRVDLAENMGAGYGFNAGFERARGKYVFYLAGDILPVPGSIKAMAEFLDENEEISFCCLNPWLSQKETEDVTFEELGRPLGLGNYAYSYALMRREILDAGCRMGDQGPFAGPGCGYEESEFANQIYAKGFQCVTFNKPSYYHDARDFRRSGHKEGTKQSNVLERKQWLKTKWVSRGIDIFGIYYLEQPVQRHVRRVAVINRKVQGQPGPAGYLAMALSDICEVETFNPGEETEGFDDYFYVDDGPSGYFEPAPFARPAHFWAIDMIVPHQTWRQHPDRYVDRARNFDHNYAAQPDAVDYFKEQGIEAELLLCAASEKVHRPHDEEVIYDWVALWHNAGERAAFARAAAERFPDGVVGWRPGENYARVMSQARCSLNLSRSKELNMRIFESMAAGVPLITDRVQHIETFFTEGEHYLGYDTLEEMLELIQWVKDHPDEAQEMANRARDVILAKHTYYRRVLQVWDHVRTI
jgi:glycosyltransferase involved in cell wall biosynthesis